MNKRGLSDIITTVLIILLVLASIVIIWTFIRPLVQKSIGGLEPGLLTSSFEIPANKVHLDATNEVIEFKVRRNAGEGKVVGLYVVLYDSNGNSERFRKNITINELETRTLSINYSGSGLGNITRLSIAPIVLNVKNEELIGKEVASWGIEQGTAGETGETGEDGEECTPSCETGKVCVSGVCQATCTNECTSGAKQCSGNGYQTCDNYDTDSCLEWSSVTNCATDETCFDGVCETCINTCSANEKKCTVDGITTCGDWDGDPCLEWNIATLCATGQGCGFGGVCLDNLKAYYSFDEISQVSGVKYAYDTSGNKYKGRIFGDTSVVAGKRGIAYNFDGSGDYVETVYIVETAVSNSVANWIYPVSSSGTIYGVALGSTYSYFLLRFIDGQLCLQAQGGYPSASACTKDYTLNQWSHVVAVSDCTNKVNKLYINGILRASKTGESCGGATENRAIYVGAMLSGSGAENYFSGKIDEMMIFNKALSQDDVTAIYNAQK